MTTSTRLAKRRTLLGRAGIAVASIALMVAASGAARADEPGWGWRAHRYERWEHERVIVQHDYYYPRQRIVIVQPPPVVERRVVVREAAPVRVYRGGYSPSGGNNLLAGAVMGAAGGLLGAQVGRGSGRVAAAAAGAVAGWLLGNGLGH